MSAPPGQPRSWGTWLVIAVPALWLVALFLVPFLIVLKISVSQTVIAQPPYQPLLDLSAGWRKDSWSVDVFLKNATDERAQMSRFAQCAALTCGSEPYTVIAQPRTLGIRVSKEF